MSESTKTETAAAVETGRYLYCLVDAECGPHDGSTTLDVTGIEDEPVSLVTGEHTTPGALVHARGEPFDSTDLTMLRDWLLAHQGVVEAAGDRFDTPLPVRFDTILDGDDDAVAGWLDSHAGQIADAFDEIAGCWEYRVTLSWDPTGFEAEQRATDAELSDIHSRRAGSGDGTQFLLDRQYDQRLRELKRQRQAALKEQLLERVEPESNKLTERPVQSDAAATLGIELDSNAVAQVALLAPTDAEQPLGAAVDEIADISGVDIRFTGPWPPYTFAPQIDDEGTP